MLACHVVSSEDANMHLKRETNSSNEKRPEPENRTEVSGASCTKSEDRLQESVKILHDADEDLEAELQESGDE